MDKPRCPPIPDSLIAWLEHVFRESLETPVDLLETPREYDRNVGVASVVNRLNKERERQQRDIRKL